ncbi:hypothetical protein Tco_0529127 [Tanacetum coccineum]
MINVRGRVIIKKENLMQGIQVWMLRVQRTSEANSRMSFSQAREDDAEALTFSHKDVNPFGGGNPGFHDDHYDDPLLTKKTESEPIIWDIGDEEEEYLFVNKYPSFQEEPIVLVEKESCHVNDTDNEEKNRCRFMILILKMSLRRKKDLFCLMRIWMGKDNVEDVLKIHASLRLRLLSNNLPMPIMVVHRSTWHFLTLTLSTLVHMTKRIGRVCGTSVFARVEKIKMLEDIKGKARTLENENVKLVAGLAQAEMDHHKLILKFVPKVIKKLHRSVEYRRSLAVPIGLCFTAGWLGGLSLGKTEDQVAAMLAETRNVDIKGSKEWQAKHQELFTVQYPFIQKVADSYRILIDNLLKISPDVPPTNVEPNPSTEANDGCSGT